MAFKDFLLPMQRQMIGHLAHDHLRQQTRSGRALFDGLRRLGSRLHRAVAGIFLAYILDHGQLCRNVFVMLTGLFPDWPQVLLAGLAVLLRIRQIVHDALSLQMLGQGLPAAAGLLFLITSRSAPARLGVMVIVILAFGVRACFRLPRLPSGGEQRQLIRRELLTFAGTFGIQQLPQQTLDLVSLGELAIQLRHQVQHHLL